MIALDTNALVRLLIEDDEKQALNHQAKKMLSFDKKLQKLFPDYVVEKLGPKDL